MRKVTVAAVQGSPVFLDRAATIAKTVDLVSAAASSGAEVVVFPETFVPGFPYWPRAYPLPHRSKSIEALELLYENSLDLDAGEGAVLAEAARDYGVYIIVGVTERDRNAGTTLFNSLLTFAPDGRLLYRQRKLLPTFDEQCLWGRGDGTDVRVQRLEFGSVGALICGNNRMTLAKAKLLLDGEEIHIAPWPGYTRQRERAELTSRSYALEGGVFVIMASSFVTADMIPKSFPLRDETEWAVDGCTGIIGPTGQWLRGPIVGREGMVIAELDPAEMVRARYATDVAGSYGRPDLFRLAVNVSPQRLRGADAEGAVWGDLDKWSILS